MKKNGKKVCCGVCGKEIYVIPSRQNRGRGKYCSRKCAAKAYKQRLGKENQNYKGDKHSFITTPRGGKYKKFDVRYIRDDNGKWIPEHRLVAEKILGRKPKREEIVHHVNCDSLDNRPENLFICSNVVHTRIHQRMATKFVRLMGEKGCQATILEVLNEQEI